MTMPSLWKYFAFVGGALLVLITFVNFLLEPSTGAKVVAQTPAQPKFVQHDPRASKIERWRDEQAALAAEKTGEAVQTPQQTPQRASVTTNPLAESSPAPLIAAPAALSTGPAADTAASATAAGAPESDATSAAAAAEQAKVEKAARIAKAKAAKARKARLARAKAEQQVARDSGQFFGGAQQRTASNQQDQFYYGQRSYSSSPAPSQGYAYAARPTFGPFGGGSGRGW